LKTLSRKTRILIPVWGERCLGRYRPQYRALSRHASIQLVGYHPDFEFREDWATHRCVDSPRGDLVDFRELFSIAVRTLGAVDDFDVILSRSRPAAHQLLDVILKELSGKPLILRAVGDGREARVRFMGYGLRKAFSDALDRITLNNCDLIIPISRRLETRLRRWVMNPARVTPPVPPAVDTNMFQPSEFPGEVVVGYAGRISPEKGSPFLRQIMEAAPDIRFKVAGHIMIPGWEFPENCHYVGELRYQNMPRFYGNVSVIVLPSYTEGLGNVVLEAYASGRPVIMTPEAAQTEFPVFGGVLPHSVSRWVDALRGLDPDRLWGEGAAARRWMTENWPTWEDYGREMYSRIRNVL